MKKNNLIHIKLDYDEAVKSRRDVLNTEADSIKIAQAIKKYRALRLKELQFKIELFKKLKETKSNLNKIKTILPKLEIPKLLKKHEEEMKTQEIFAEAKEITGTKSKTKKKKKPEKKQKIQKPKSDDLELQLKEIQKKLAKLE